MSDEKDEFGKAVEAALGPRALRVLHKAIVVDQASDGSLGLKLPGAGAPSATAKPVPLWLGLPGFEARLKAGSEISVGFHEGAEDGAYSALFPFFPQSAPEVPLPLPLIVLKFGGGDRPIARKEDTVACGVVVFRQTPVGPSGVPSILAITYRNELGAETPILTMPIPGPMIPLAPDPNDPTAAVMPIGGYITSGREEFRA